MAVGWGGEGGSGAEWGAGGSGMGLWGQNLGSGTVQQAGTSLPCSSDCYGLHPRSILVDILDFFFHIEHFEKEYIEEKNKSS